MFYFDNDDDVDLIDLVEADIEYGLFEEDDKITNKIIKKKNQKTKSFWDIFKI